VHTFTRAFSVFGRRALLLVALALALALVGTALSASSGAKYRGKVKGGGALSFRTTATKVIGFKASTSPLCISVAAASSMVKVYLIRGLPSAKLKNGHFKINYHGPFSTYITVTGKIKGKKASGRINFHYTLTNGTVIYACQQKATWKAKRI
jgi:hypothetical protein